MYESVKIEKKSVENMNDELEILLGEIPHATSSLNLHNTQSNVHHYSLVDHTSHLTQKMNVHGMYDDELLRHKYACASSPACGFSLQSDGSSSSLFSGGRSFSDNGSPSPPHFGELKPHLVSGNGFWLDFNKANEINTVEGRSLSSNFSKMYISNEEEDISFSPNGFQFRDQSMDGPIRMNFENFMSSDDYSRGFSERRGFNSSIPRSPMKFDGEMDSALLAVPPDSRMGNLLGHRYYPGASEGLFARTECGNSASSPQFYKSNVPAGNYFPMGISASKTSSTLKRPSFVDSSFYASQNRTNPIKDVDPFHSPYMLQLAQLIPQFNVENLLHYQQPVPNGRNRLPSHVRVPHGDVEAFTGEDSLILQGDGLNYAINKGCGHPSVQNAKSFMHGSGTSKAQEIAGLQESGRTTRMHIPFSWPSKCSSLTDAQGYIYHIAKDQHGCRFLQRMFDEGTPRDVQIIFSEIVDHAVELITNPFGNYLMQKLLDVCNEEQRIQILLRVTEVPGELVRISLNTHGTRVVQKLIETLKTRQQISLVISALEPGFLALIKDLNGNHVLQRCLQCFTNEDSKFIFVAAAKFCVDIATHQHGCCVLQRCISHSTGEHWENLVAEISANGLLLAQDAYGNYVVQFILELKIPSVTSKLTSQFDGNYVHLSTQKFSSHVVEKCLAVCNDEVRSKIIHELLSETYFEQLLHDPHANYVVQTALQVSEGPLHNSLVDAIESHRAISGHSPYSKRIFSHKLLKK
ncbi:pumilio homolog 7, chloroplastic [Olea europaea subsp. europaea]|uniref:Pumilio homolog 7, chloroplastic n=1 Tax=Olea europaea subsp. europaea TaxID=158383 RepID=A0A8S0QNC8_OLEEU|nr:pumilio homolog 7, chloroplastic [Olea europaea subsp. europaea]